MKEVTFIRRNIDKWKEAEKVVEQATNLSPDRLADVYTDLTADLGVCTNALSYFTYFHLPEQPCFCTT